jgi:PAS domain S-box-containing protein
MTEKIRILIVEDEGMVAEDLKEMLTGMGYEVPGTVDTGEGAIAFADELHPDLILMDINLSGAMDGITAGGEIRSRWGIPLIYVTAFATPEMIDRAKKTTPSGYIVKPFNERQIQTAIEIALYNAAIERQLKVRDETIRTLLDRIDNPALLLDVKGTIIALNEAMTKRVGIMPEHLLGTSYLDLIPEGGITVRLSGAIQQARLGKQATFEEEFKNVWYNNTILPISDSHGTVQSIAVYCTDITFKKASGIVQKTLNEQLAFERTHLALRTAALDSINNPIIITGSGGAISYANDAFLKMIGYPLPYVIEKNIHDFAAPENRFPLGPDSFMGDQNSVWNGEFIARNRFGVTITLLFKSTPLIIDNVTKNRIFVFFEGAKSGTTGTGSPQSPPHKGTK